MGIYHQYYQPLCSLPGKLLDYGAERLRNMTNATYDIIMRWGGSRILEWGPLGAITSNGRHIAGTF